MTYDELVQLVGFYMQQEQPHASFAGSVAAFIQMAEDRCYRALDLAASSDSNFSMQTVQLSNTIDLTHLSGTTVQGYPTMVQWPEIVEEIAARVGNRWIPFIPASLQWVDNVWPDLTVTAAPSVELAYFNMLDEQRVRIAPVPDAVYPLRVTGVWRPATLSPTVQNTYVGDYLSDVLLPAVMVEAYGYQRDFGTAADDPAAAMSWQTKYNEAMASAKEVEERRKGLGAGYQAYRMPAAAAKAPA